MDELLLTAESVTMRHRFQSITEQRDLAQSALQAAKEQIEKCEKASEEKTAQVAHFAGELAEVQKQKVMIEFELQHCRQQLGTLGGESAAATELAAQIGALTQQLADALSKAHLASAEKEATQKDLDSAREQLEIRQAEIGTITTNLANKTEEVATWKNRHQALEVQTAPMQRRLEEKMEAWNQKESESVATIAELSQERDALRVELAKKNDELIKARTIAKSASDVFAECLTKVHRHNSSAPESGEPSEQKPVEEDIPISLSYIKLPAVEQFQYARSSPARFKGSTDIEGMSIDELRVRHRELVSKYNDEVAASISDEVRVQHLMKNCRGAVARCRVVHFEFSELSKIARANQQKAEELTETTAQLRGELRGLKEAKEEERTMVPVLEKMVADYAAQVKFLLKRIEANDRVAGNEPNARHLVPDSNADHPQPTCIHDVVETNKELARENYTLKKDLEELKAKMARQAGTSGPMEEEITPDYDEYDNIPSHKRPIDYDPPGPSNKKQRTQPTAGPEAKEDESAWKTKWEDVSSELSSTRASYLQLETELRQELEKAQTQNAIYADQVKQLDKRCVEYEARHKRVMDAKKHEGDTFIDKLQFKNGKMKEMDVVIQKLTQELDDLKAELGNQGKEHEVTEYKLEQEKKAFDKLQIRSFEAEKAHMAEIEEIKGRYEEQIRENAKNLVPATGGNSMDKGGLSSDEAARLKQQLEQKDSTIRELSRRLTNRTETQTKDRDYDLSTSLAVAQSEATAEKQRANLVEQGLVLTKESHEKEIKVAKHEAAKAATDNDRIIKLEAERDAANLEILRWKGQCDGLRQEQERVKKDLEAMSISHEETTNDLIARMNRLRSENSRLGNVADERNTFHEACQAENAILARRVHALNLEVETLRKAVAESKKKQEEAEKKAAEAAQQSIQLSLPIQSEEKLPEEEKPVPMETQPPETQPPETQPVEIESPPLEKKDSGELSVKSAVSAPRAIPAETRLEAAKFPAPGMLGEKRDLDTLLRMAKDSYQETQSVQPQSTPPHHAESSGGPSGIQSDAEGTGTKSPTAEEGTEEERATKKQKWTPIVYSSTKKDEPGDDKKSERGDKKPDRGAKH